MVTIRNILKEAFSKWEKSYMAPGVKEAIGNIPDPGRIKRVVCVGLDLIEYSVDRRWLKRDNEPTTAVAPLAQHVAALAIVKQLRHMTQQTVELYTADPAYGPSHKEALETLDAIESIGIKFNVCDVSYGVHEQYLNINEETLLFTGPASCRVLRAVSEYTRPAVIICEGLDRDADSRASKEEPQPLPPDYL